MNYFDPESGVCELRPVAPDISGAARSTDWVTGDGLEPSTSGVGGGPALVPVGGYPPRIGTPGLNRTNAAPNGRFGPDPASGSGPGASQASFPNSTTQQPL